jgi:hypothetical protein
MSGVRRQVSGIRRVEYQTRRAKTKAETTQRAAIANFLMPDA